MSVHPRADSADGSSTSSRLSQGRQVGLYLALAFILSWWVWPFTLANPESTAMVAFGPIIAAIIVTAWADGRAAVGSLLRKLVHWRVRPIWYAVALGGPVLVVVITGAVSAVLGATFDAAGAIDGWYSFPLATLSGLLVGGALFEELGWRGFLLPRLQSRWGALRAALVIGVIWALWHLPLLVSDPTAQRPPLPYLLWLVALSVLLTWLYNSTGRGVLLPMIMHAAYNTAAAWLLREVPQADYMTVWWVFTAVSCLAAGAVVAFTQPSTLTARSDASVRAPTGVATT